MQKLIDSLLSSLSVDISLITSGRPPKKEHGDIMLNVFALAKSQGIPPNVCAENIAGLLAQHSLVASLSTIGGYVNIVLSTEGVRVLAEDSLHLVPQTILANTHTIIDYIGLNVWKPAHIGHLCTPTLGQSMIEMTRFLGGRVTSDSHFGDWGGIFGKLIVAFEKYGNREELEKSPIDHLFHLYVKITADTEANPEIDQECRDAFVELSKGNPYHVELWREFTDYTTQESNRMMDIIGVKCDYHIGESFYQWIPAINTTFTSVPPLQYTMQMIVDELLQKGIATKNEDGSVGVVFDESFKLPSTIIQKKDGAMLYTTSDIASIKYRLTNGWNPTAIWYFADIRQSLHFRQIFAIAQLAWPELLEGVDFFHAGNGTVRLKDGAMSTRKGNIIRLETLIDDAFDRVASVLKEKDRILSDEDLHAIAVGAVKYAYLSQDREKDIVFDTEKATALEWNSGPYIQYASVRAQEILRQAGNVSTEYTLTPEMISAYDRELILVLAESLKAITDAHSRIKPHILATQVYALASTFNAFYSHSGKITTENDQNLKAWRLSLVQASYEHLRTLFALLAIPLPQHM